MHGNEPQRLWRPILLLGYADSALASRCVRSFRRLGWEVHMAPGGREVRRLLEDLTPHVIVLDVALADEDGWQCCARLSAEPTHPRVILLADVVDEAAQARAAAAGAVALLCRDDAPEALVELIYGQRLAEAV